MFADEENENIFSYELRTLKSITKSSRQFKGMSQSEIEKNLGEQNERERQKMERFFQSHYAQFDIKINNCKLRCANQSESYAQIHQCYNKCEMGRKNFSSFIDNKISDMEKLLSNCVGAAQKNPNVLHEVYYCYKLFNNGFSYLRKLVDEESSYYE